MNLLCVGISLLSALPFAQTAAATDTASAIERITTTASVEEVDADVLGLLMVGVSWQNAETEVEKEVATLVLAVARNERAKISRSAGELRRHRIASFVGFIVAHAMIVFGLVCGVAEYRQANRLRRRGKAVEQLDLSLGIEGVALKSSFNGTLILLVAFAFYVAYLRYVFPLAPI